jgi:isochorismate synthase
MRPTVDDATLRSDRRPRRSDRLSIGAVPQLADSIGLLTQWVPGSSTWFSGPRGSLLAQGCARRLDSADPAHVASVLRDVAAADTAPPIVVGALPFDADDAPALVVPEAVHWAAPIAGAEGLPAPRLRDRPAGRLRPVPDPAGYEAMVTEALRRMAAGALDKVVLARVLELIATDRVDAPAMLRELAARDPRGYLFAVGLPTPGPAPRTLIGASPELLLSRSGDVVVANPLAGSAPRDADPVVDAARGAALLASAKDRHEHALVVSAVADALRPRCRRLFVPAEPELVRTETLWHLSTRLEGEVDPSVSALALARALHPTPAVCGVPTAAARTAIAEIEPFERDFYTGMVGWTDASGDGEWVVALRCGQVEGRSVRLYAGAGIVPGSRPAAELEETAVKLRTQLRALGLDARG